MFSGVDTCTQTSFPGKSNFKKTGVCQPTYAHTGIIRVSLDITQLTALLIVVLFVSTLQVGHCYHRTLELAMNHQIH